MANPFKRQPPQSIDLLAMSDEDFVRLLTEATGQSVADTQAAMVSSMIQDALRQPDRQQQEFQLRLAKSCAQQLGLTSERLLASLPGRLLAAIQPQED